MSNRPKNPRRAAQKMLSKRAPVAQTTAEAELAPLPQPQQPPQEEYASAQDVPYEEPAPPPMTAVQKVKFMNALATAAQDEDLMGKVMEMEHGELIWGLFEGAINRQLESLMNGANEELEEAGANIYNTAQDCNFIRQTMTDFHRLVQSFVGTPLVQTLQVLNQNLGGQGPAPAPPQQQYAGPQGNQQQYAPQQPQRQYPPGVHARPPQQPSTTQQDDVDRGSGIGSY